MEKPQEFLTNDTWATDIESAVRIFAALHIGIEDPEDRCVSLAVGQSAVTFEANVARGLGTMLLQAAEALDKGEAQPVTRGLEDDGDDDYDIVSVT